jgi:integrase
MLPPKLIPEYVAALRQVDRPPAKALELIILTAARLGEAGGATWQEIDLEARLWVIPGHRMKEGEGHTVPLSGAAVALLEALPRSSTRVGELVFAGVTYKAIRAVTKATRPDLPPRTIHGFRATFRTWAGDSGYPRELAEQALAHAVGDKTEQAYNRTNYLERRRPMMQTWADFCAGKVSADNVVELNRARAAQ